MRHSRKHTPAFTLVEMLAVILVIGILVAVVVGVAGSGIAKAAEKQTKLTMATIMVAIDAYYYAEKAWPVATGGTPQQRSAALFSRLTASPASKKSVGELSRSAISSGHFVDGFEGPIDYHASGGAGGGPYLESAGRDGDFGSKEDNIRSDGM